METIAFLKHALECGFIKSYKPEDIHKFLYKNGILSIYNKTDSRIVLYTSKNERFTNLVQKNNNNSNNIPIVVWAECNGIVLDTSTMKPLSIPPYTYRSNIDINLVNNYIYKGLYSISLIEDGTTITLYYYDKLNKWCISTNRGYDMTDVKWETKTYITLVTDLVELYKTSMDVFLNTLDKTSCYTFGFKHADMHPFWEGLNKPINKIWFIQSVNLTTGIRSYTFDNKFSIPDQKILNINNISNTCGFMLSKCNSALNTFISYKSPESALYGYLLRSNDIINMGIYSNILLESTLLQKIRQLYYDSNINKQNKLLNYNRDTFINIDAYLSINKVELFFKCIFPQYIQNYDKLENITKTLASDIVIFAQSKSTDNIVYKKYAPKLFEQISHEYTISVNKGYNENIILSYLKNIKFLNLYHELYNKLSPNVSLTSLVLMDDS